MDEETIYKGLMNHDEAVYQWVIQKYSKLLWAVAITVITSNNRSAAMDIEEVISDTFVRLWQAPEKFDPKRGTLKNYLAVIAKSLAINKVKQNQKQLFHLVEEQELAVKEELLSEEQDWQELYTAIQQLEEPTKEIIIRRFFYGEKPGKIEQTMHLSAKEIDNRLYRGKKKLRQLIEEKNFFREAENV